MGRKKLTVKAKRNNFTLSIEAQEIIDQQKNKSKFVSDAILYFQAKKAIHNKQHA